MSAARARSDTAGRIRTKYGRGRRGQSFAAIGREFDVSRQLVHAVLARPGMSVPRRRMAPRTSARPFVLRLPEALSRGVRVEANARATTVSAVVLAAITAYLDGREGKEAA